VTKNHSNKGFLRRKQVKQWHSFAVTLYICGNGAFLKQLYSPVALHAAVYNNTTNKLLVIRKCCILIWPTFYIQDWQCLQTIYKDYFLSYNIYVY